jgi:hypothetical protein
MKALPQKLRKNGFDYILVLRGHRSCIYEQRLMGKFIAFEVFIIRTSPRRKILEKWIEEHELFHHNESFGYTAWTFMSWEKALEGYNQIEHGLNAEYKK